MIILLFLLCLSLSIAADFAFLRSLKRFLAPRYLRYFRRTCFLLEFYLLGYIILLLTSRSMVLPAPGWTLAAMTILFPKILFVLLWTIFVWPLFRTKIASYNFLSACILSAILGGIILHGGLKERFLVQVNRVEISSPHLPCSFDGYRIAQISDFHLGSLTLKDTTFVRRVTDSILALQPDIVCFTGDLVNCESEEARPFINELRRMRTRRHQVFAILGNHDYADYARTMPDSLHQADADTLRHLITTAGWTLLDNRGEIIRHRAERSANDYYDPTEYIRIVGVGNIGEPPFTTYGDLRTALASLPDASTNTDTTSTRPFTILLSHNPTHWRQEVLPDSEIDLMLAGHTHGMQIKIAGFSPAVWKYKEWGGLYSENDRHLYVNTGLGTVGFPARIGLKPEITLITLRCEK